MVRLHIHPDKATAVRAVAADIAQLIQTRSAAGKRTVLGLATGSTPIPLYAELVRLHREQGLSFRKVTTFNLDEYSGLGPDHDQSYRWFMQQQLFNHVDITASETHVPDGLAKDVSRAAAAYEQAIQAAGGIDLQVLGIGRTGHIGFNEPPAGPTTRTRQVHLDALTRRDNAVFFGDLEKVPHHAVTMGVGTILDCRRVVLLAWGEGKADIIRRSLEDQPSEDCPASWLQDHPACDVVLDTPAAAKLTSR